MGEKNNNNTDHKAVISIEVSLLKWKSTHTRVILRNFVSLHWFKDQYVFMCERVCIRVDVLNRLWATLFFYILDSLPILNKFAIKTQLDLSFIFVVSHLVCHQFVVFCWCFCCCDRICLNLKLNFGRVCTCNHRIPFSVCMYSALTIFIRIYDCSTHFISWFAKSRKKNWNNIYQLIMLHNPTIT